MTVTCNMMHTRYKREIGRGEQDKVGVSWQRKKKPLIPTKISVGCKSGHGQSLKKNFKVWELMRKRKRNRADKSMGLRTAEFIL